jgi:MFS family permease
VHVLRMRFVVYDDSVPGPEDGRTRVPAGPLNRRTTTWRSVLANHEYAALWAAYALSLAGDQLARVALAVLVYDRTDSALATATAYAVTFLPMAIGGPLLGGLGDRLPRRSVLIACDVASAVLVGMMALPGLNLVALCALLFFAVLLAAPFTAARSSLVRDLFDDDEQYAAATALTTVTIQGSQVAGFAIGGVLVAAVGSRQALLLDSLTFVLSAVLIVVLVRRRAAAANPGRGGHWADIAAGARLVFGNPRLRVLALFAWLAAFHSLPAGVVVPYVDDRGGGPRTIGLLMAALTLGSAASMVIITNRVPAARRLRLLPPLALLASAGLIPCLFDPPLVVVGFLWMLSGLGTGYQLAANVAFVTAVPPERRAQAFGMVGSGMAAGQGLGLIAAGALTNFIQPYALVGLAGIVGTVVTLLLLATPASRALR